MSFQYPFDGAQVNRYVEQVRRERASRRARARWRKEQRLRRTR